MTYRQLVDFCYEFTLTEFVAAHAAAQVGIAENTANTWFKFLCQVSYVLNLIYSLSFVICFNLDFIIWTD